MATIFDEEKQLLNTIRATHANSKEFRSLCEDFFHSMIATFGSGGEGYFKRNCYIPKRKTPDNVNAILFLGFDDRIVYHCDNSHRVCKVEDLKPATLRILVEDLAKYAIDVPEYLVRCYTPVPL